jgi:phosphoheptose isomerase
MSTTTEVKAPNLKDNIAQMVAVLQALEGFDEKMIHAASIVARCLHIDNKVMICGNGGSASDAGDFSTEFLCRFVESRRPYPVLDLSAAGSTLTAIANDYGFEHVFSRQVRALAKQDDVLIAISTSGNSPSIVNALKMSRERNIASIAFLGKGGGACKGIASTEFIVPSDVTARIQEAHKFLLHTLCEMVEDRLPPIKK